MPVLRPGSKGIKVRRSPDGTWEAYEYRNVLGTTGPLKRKFRPFGTSASSPPSATDPATWSDSAGEITEYTYATPIRLGRIGTEKTKVNGAIINQYSIEYSEQTNVNGKTIVTAKRTEASLEKTTKYYKEDTVDTLFRDQIHSVKNSDGTKQSFVYQRGGYDASSHAFTANATGDSVRTIMIKGTSSSGRRVHDLDEL